VSAESVNSFPDALSFAKAILTEILEGLFEGNGSCIGIPELRAGDMIDIAGVGKRFSGKYRLRKVTHTIDSGGYRTSFEVTQRSGANMLQLFRKIFEEEPSPNQQKKMNGAVVGKVINNVDPEGLGRVQIAYPGMDEKLISPGAKVVSQDIGNYFMPDIGEDVLVNFEKGDFDRPLVTGSYWNVANKHPEGSTPDNFRKVIQSRTGHKIILDDTPGKGGVTLESMAGAKIMLDAQGNINLQAAGKNITLNASENTITLNGTSGEILVQAKVKATIKGGQVHLNPPA
jgi:uncharacterized protein involved in type VI secretion and phage assembly